MYLLYLDDAGSPGNQAEEYFILGGVAVPESSVRWLSYEIERYALTISEETGIDPKHIEFHASEIFSGKTAPWDSIREKENRINVIKNVLCLLEHAYQNVATFACAIHKKSFPTDDPVLTAFEDVSSRFDYYLQRISPGERGEKGLIILDKSSYETGLQNLTTTFREQGNRWGNQLRRIVDIPFFVDSQTCRIVQLADHIAYSVFRRYNAGDLNYFNCVEARFDQSDGTVHGLSHKQTYNRDCTCPACITRRR